MAITGEPEGDPMKIGVALADVLAGKDAAIAILARAGSARPDRNGGRRMSISLVDSARAALVNVAQNALVSGADAKRWGNAHPNLVPYQLFRAADRPIVVAVGSDAQWRACARAIGLARSRRRSRRLRPMPVVWRSASASLQSSHGQLRDRAGRASGARGSMRAGVPNGVVQTVLEVLRETNGSAVTGMPSSVGGDDSLRAAGPRRARRSDSPREAWSAFAGPNRGGA